MRDAGSVSDGVPAARMNRRGSRTTAARRALGVALTLVTAVALGACGDSSTSGSAIRDASVERLASGDLVVSWTAVPDAGEVTVYAGRDPDAIARDVAVGKGGPSGSAVVAGLDPARRTYFAVVAGRSELVVAERRVPLVGAVNFRDLGGYATASGKRVAWGKVFRSDQLDRLTEADQAIFSNLGVKLVCDFRSPTEVGRSPDRLPPDDASEVLHLPIYDPENDYEAEIRGAITSADFARQEELLGGGRNEQLLIDGNRFLVTKATDQYAGCLRRLADPAALPALTHCTAGKDRTGFSSAILLLALGVPESVVMEDYLLSNAYLAERNEQTIASVGPLMRDPELLRPVLEVRPEYLQASFDAIREIYGDVETYLREGLGLDPATLRRLRENLLR
ncbi:MAG TPA: tyrosine-protein phosphatase [Candidatus Binatia bacterium]|nr:tyrosine-protein phosphatase [Candidatus Binatia bacterium]